MVIKTHYTTASTGARIPIEITVKRTTQEVALNHMTAKDRAERNSWCTKGKKACAKYGERPCCPPKTKMFNEMKPHKYMYLIQVKILLEDYYTVYPNVRASGSWQYFGMDGTHKMTRNVSNKIVRAISEVGKDIPFRVGGCLGCQFLKTGKCNYYMPPLESTGINVVKLAKTVFNTDIVWRVPKESMPYMIAVGAIYTDRENIPQSKFKGVIKDVCNNN